MNEGINQRFLEIFRESGLSQEKFGIPIGMTRSEVKNIIYGITTLKEKHIPLVCEKYGYREEWLRTGKMPKRQPTTIGEGIGEVAAKASKNDPEDAKQFFQNLYKELGEEKFLLLYEIFRQMFPQYDPQRKEQKNED